MTVRHVKSNKFQIGEVVRLKSGGPPMTISEIQEWDNNPGQILIECHWFATDRHGSEKREWHSFAEEMLVKVNQ